MSYSYPMSSLPALNLLFAPASLEDAGMGYCVKTHAKNLKKLRGMLMEVNDPIQCMLAVDYIQKLGIDYHFKDETASMLCSLHKHYATYTENEQMSDDLFQVSLSFRLLKQAGYSPSSDMFGKHMNNQGRTELDQRKNIPELLSLYEASQMDTGEDIFKKATEYSRLQLQTCMKDLEPAAVRLVENKLMNPYHKTIPRYHARIYLDQCKIDGYSINEAIENLARFDFNQVQLLHHHELQEILRWWKSTGIAEELKLKQNQPVKWYLWPMAAIPDPQFSYCRIQITKIIALIYVIDDLFDIYGSPAELDLFTKSINEWNLSCTNTLPRYMRQCYETLYNTTKEIAQTISNEHGLDAFTSLKKMWSRMVNAYLLESRWFRSKRIPKPEEYLKTALITCGMQTVLMHTYFLLGEGITDENVEFLEGNPPIFSGPATILRLWDDLEENQEGFDGSYVECLLKQYPKYSTQTARDHVKELITKTWEELNKECFSGNHFSPNLLIVSLNFAKMVEVLYRYDENKSHPLFEDYVNNLLFKRA